MSQSNSESDIWEYKPLKKTKRQNNKSQKCSESAAKRQRVNKQGKAKKQTEDQNAKNKGCNGSSTRNHLPEESVQNTSINGSLTTDPETQAAASPEGDTESQGYCPICQMPFSILVVQSERWHVAECLDTPGETSKECPFGLQCSSSIPNHYKRYCHSLLAHSRAINSPDSRLAPSDQSHLEQTLYVSDAIISRKESSVDSAVNLSSVSSQSASPSHGSKQSCTPVGQPNALMRLRSPDPEDIKKKKGWSPSAKVSRSQCSSQEPKIRSSTPVKAEGICCAVQTVEVKEEPSALNNNNDDNDDYISYSPLSELPAETDVICSKKKLFQSTAVEEADNDDDNDSLMLFDETVSEDGLLSDVLEQFERSQEDSLSTEAPPVTTCDQLESLDPIEDVADEAFGSHSSVKPSQYKQLVKDSEGKGSKTQLQSPGSLVLERLRDHLSNPADFNSLDSTCAEIDSVSEMPSTMLTTKNQSLSTITPSKTQNKVSGLKQTDIGVFFGLKPLSKKAEEKVNSVKEEVSSTPRKSSGPAGRNTKRQGRQRGKSAAVHEESTATEAVEEGAAQPTQTEGGRGVRAGGRKRWNRGRATDGGPVEPRRCPFYKKIPGTGFVVDAFQYGTIEGITAYFLTHFHSDHYGGLTKRSTLPIYCNKITGNLVKSKLKVDEQYVHILPMNTDCVVDGVKVTLLDANHCPGAAMLLFLLPDGQTVLHTGDFRADPSMERYPELQGFRVQTLYLDTTYCSPEYAFPTQQEVITFAANTAFELVTLNPRTLVVCGTYAVGKEKVFLAISDVLASKVYMSRDRYNTMCCLESKQICQCITTDPKAARVHVLPMMQLNFKNLEAHLHKHSQSYDQLVAFKPTGWTFTHSGDVTNIQPEVKNNISIYGIPYSEHSSFLELKRFVQWLQPLKIIPTVNVGSWSSRKVMQQCFSEWQTEAKALNTVPRKGCRSSYTRQ
ncbi:DNA cross-link repair 1A protein [Astyanax mexicanus]|uniref:DNA cross-link repair 1A protein n=1 Tax=Astyanax mexicanus TaxID=7994 RepID=UPI0020CAEAC6|nr:DNA cross-link repair 1A protein [Astyanax mexicanus]